MITKKILEMLGVNNEVALKEDTMSAYEARIRELRKL